MVIYAKEQEDKYKLAKVKFYMLFGSEDIPYKDEKTFSLIEEPFSRVITIEEWMNSPAGKPYTDDKFRMMFQLFIDNFNCVNWL